MATHIDPFEALRERFARIARLDHAATYLSWDQMVMMPPGGNDARSESLAELATLSHEALVAPEVGDWLSAAQESGGSLQATAGAEAVKSSQDPAARLASRQARLREMQRVRRESTALPASLVRARILAGAVCEAGWRSQRPANDWAGFVENFRPVVALSREAADAHREAGGHASRYEALMSLYCAGDDPARVATMFVTLRLALPGLLARVMERQARNPVPTLAGPFPIQAQVGLGRSLAQRLGFDFDAGRLDTSAHPFSTGSHGDLRITTRYRDTDCFDALQAIAHEIGHASYEGGLPRALSGEPAGASRSMSVHESQSLFFEKHLFLSRAFTDAFAGDVQAALPALSGIDASTLWRSQLRVGPSRIRVEADEVTYPLHVMLRHDIERALMDGSLEADDLPDAWNEGMHELLGIDTRGDFRNGCLQDIHWSEGSFGYFPSYTLGAINAAELAASLERELPRWRHDLAAGRDGTIDALRDWLGRLIWSRASSVDAGTLLRDAIGHEPDPAALLAHLERRYVEETI